MWNKVLPHPLLSVFLLLVWLLLNNTVAMGHVVLGAVLALLIPLLTLGFWPERVVVRHPWVLLKFLLVVLWDIVVANLHVAALILGSARTLQPAFMVMELDIRSPLGASILANTISLTPGTVSCELSTDRRQLLIHALHVDDVDASLREMKQRYERPLMEVLQVC
ncbi:Na+/H+ antiporter subunit E [Thiothrix lacustris]|uniref:Na+/H+ antiporter subunit E n=1 Tax=Thiothrix lacustris TaxID=525917 RepID=A0ABY9MU25_9GAMM|nr:Na+/H+ antiporter subunit E [Thiothrix lacustris]WML91291.1 Na+/H+ antiporter subunit E [Thiothrix lacustris]WMP18146.1 Na+/H+ antiporter subunit E [Thiothrix lacustris]